MAVRLSHILLSVKEETMYKKQELIKLWSNDKKRKAFVEDYKTWGVWFTQPELDLTFYKFDFENGSRLIVMEYLRSPYTSERTRIQSKSILCRRYYLQTGDYFNPSAVSDFAIAEHLKLMKMQLSFELNGNKVA